MRSRPDMVGRVEAAGLWAKELTSAYAELDRSSFHPLASVFGYTRSPTVGDELVDVVTRDAPDVVVIDGMFSAALQVAPHFHVPTVMMLHTFFDRLIDGWRANFAMQSDSRVRAGFDPLADLDVLWANATSSTSTRWARSTGSRPPRGPTSCTGRPCW